MSSIINADTSGGLKLESDVSGQLEIQTAAATKVTVTSAGNVGIGTSTPAQKFVVSDGGVNFATSVSGSVQNIGTFTDNTLAVIANSVEQMRVTSAGLLSFNSGYGSVAPAYGCRAWVNFNGSGTVAIRDSANVSSITDNGVGDYTVNFTTAMVDANYSVVGSGQGNGDFNRGAGLILDLPKLGTTPTTSAIRFTAGVGSSINAFPGAFYDSVYIYLSVLR
tara:strand:+ start:2107 stop:2769 length:663 start_codon:yes stop_codon:yes gene_type:complete